jgi:trigger factor
MRFSQLELMRQDTKEESKMSLQVERLDNSMAKLTIEVPAEEVEKALQGAYLKERKQISLPGFRKGKVPRQMIEKMYGPQIFYEEAAHILINDNYPKAYEESELEIMSRPEIDVVQLEKGKEFIFTAEVALKPDVILGEYKGLTYTSTEEDVTEEEVQEEINKELEKNSRTIDITDRPVQDKDMIKLDFEGFVDDVAFEGGKGEDFSLEIGSGSFIPGFEEQLIGAEIGEELDVNVTFPLEYQAKEMAGKPALFKCKVKEIQMKEYPECDDDFAAEVSEFETLDEYKADIRERLQEQKDSKAKQEKENQVVEKAIENATIDIPEPMILMEIEQMTENFTRRIEQQGLNMEQYFQFTGSSKEKLLEEMRPQAVNRIKTRLLLEAIAKKENIVVSDERVTEEMEKMAGMYGMEPDKVKELMAGKETNRLKEDMAVQDAITLISDAAFEE